MSRVSVLRKTMLKYINENACAIISYKRPLIDNGYGILIPDLDQAAVPVILGTARMSRRSLPDPYISGSTTAYDYKDVYYLLVPYDATWLKKGIVFECKGNKFKTRIPENRITFGEVVYQLCGLEQVTSGDVGDYSG